MAALERAITPRTRMALLDHVTSETALVMPLAEMAAACRARGVAVLVDGAHAPGAIDVDIAALGVDWYVANLHKWAFAPRSCGVLWAAPGRRRDLHPGVLSWGVTSGDWLQEFDWTGTRDPSPWLAAPAALDFMHDVLGVDGDARATTTRSRVEARGDARAALAAAVDDARVDGRLHGHACPCPSVSVPASRRRAQRLRDALLERHAIEVPVIARAGALWARVSVQVYNEAGDIERLADAVEALC